MSLYLKQFFQKQRAQVLLGLLFSLFFFSSTSAIAKSDYRNQEHIQNFDVKIAVNADSTILIRENINYHFVLKRHGIFRDIPVEYTDQYGQNKSILIDTIKVVNERGIDYPFTISQEGDNKRIKIGDPDVLIDGDHTYIISYSVHNVIGYFDTFDEFYWNVTGNDWEVPILSSLVEIAAPVAMRWRDWNFSCYVGLRGSSISCGDKDSFLLGHTDEELVTKAGFSFAEKILNPGEGITIALGFPKGLVTQPTKWEQTILFLMNNSIVFLPGAVFIYMFTLWHKRGRDPRGLGTIIPEYAVPEQLSPLEIAGILENKISGENISAAIIDLAVNGYIRIEHVEEEGALFFKKTDYIFHRLEKSVVKGSLEENLLFAIFGMDEFRGKFVRLSFLKEKFYIEIQALQDNALSFLVRKGYFDRDPRNTVIFYLLIGIPVAFIALIFGLFFGMVGILSAVVSIIIYFVFAYLMPRLTMKGARIKESLYGLKMYLQIAEKSRLEFHNAPEKTPQLFEKLLPAAMILGVSDSWAKEFQDIFIEPPSWYIGPSNQPFIFSSFHTDLNSFSSFSASNLMVGPSMNGVGSATGGFSGSGGGGFSGGGFGGGGGGSW